jgi:ferredoxin
MATTITSECINCGACEPECPNTAIYGGGVPWELNGETHPGISQEIYYIVPEKCTECVGFHDHEACAAVCPVDCCIPDPKNLESEAVLIERAKVLHPEQAFGADFPSRFRKEAAAPAEGNGAAKAVDAAPAPAAAAAAAQSDESDPIAWEVPVRCKDCHEIYAIPYRHFQAGVVFYCPNCSGSFVPDSVICRTVRSAFEDFYTRRQREREAFERKRARELGQFEAKQAAEMEAFQERLKRLADEMKPAGKLVRPKGIASMFT